MGSYLFGNVTALAGLKIKHKLILEGEVLPALKFSFPAYLFRSAFPSFQMFGITSINSSQNTHIFPFFLREENHTEFLISCSVKHIYPTLNYGMPWNPVLNCLPFILFINIFCTHIGTFNSVVKCIIFFFVQDLRMCSDQFAPNKGGRDLTLIYLFF